MLLNFMPNFLTNVTCKKKDGNFFLVGFSMNYTRSLYHAINQYELIPLLYLFLLDKPSYEKT